MNGQNQIFWAVGFLEFFGYGDIGVYAMDSLLDYVSQKHLAGILYAAVMIFEISCGFLNDFSAYSKKIPKNQYRKILMLASTAAFLLLFLDEPLLNLVQRIPENSLAASLIQFGAYWGKNVYVWGFFSLLYLAAFLLRKKSFQKIALGVLISSGLTSLCVQMVKYAFARARPLTDLGSFAFFNYAAVWKKGGGAYLSFSSGDVAISAGAMALLFLAVKNPSRYLFLGIALLTCLSRIYLDKHWPSDVTFSFILSFLFADFVWGYIRYKKSLVDRG